jgi:hypothetical protein
MEVEAVVPIVAAWLVKQIFVHLVQRELEKAEDSQHPAITTVGLIAVALL